MKNKKLLILVLIGVTITILLIVLFIAFLSYAYTSYINRTTLKTTPVDVRDQVVRKKEKTSTISDLYKIECKQRTTKPYNGYVIGDTIECILKYNTEVENFLDEDNELDKVNITINPSKSLVLKDTYLTGPFDNPKNNSLELNIYSNKLTITNTEQYGVLNSTYCDIKYYACEYQYQSKRRSKINAYNYEYNHNSIKGLELHIEFDIQSNLSKSNPISFDITSKTVTYHFKDYSIKPYKSTNNYKYDINNNDKYYVFNKKIYKLDNYNEYKEIEKISCIEYNCNVYNKDTLNLGYAVIKEDTGKQYDTYNRVWDIEKHEEYKTYKALYIVKEEDKVYLIGNNEEDINTFTITRLNDKQELKSFTVPESSKINNISIVNNKIVVSIANQESLELDI